MSGNSGEEEKRVRRFSDPAPLAAACDKIFLSKFR